LQVSCDTTNKFIYDNNAIKAWTVWIRSSKNNYLCFNVLL